MPDQIVTYLDPERLGYVARKIRITRHRNYTDVELDRDGWYADGYGVGNDIPQEFKDTAAHARMACIERLWLDGHKGGFYYGVSGRHVQLYVTHTYATLAAEALTSAELRQDYGPLRALEAANALPYDEWLAPGERRLTRGVDFLMTASGFMRLLREEAKKRGVRLNGRIEGSSVIARPTH